MSSLPVARAARIARTRRAVTVAVAVVVVGASMLLHPGAAFASAPCNFFSHGLSFDITANPVISLDNSSPQHILVDGSECSGVDFGVATVANTLSIGPGSGTGHFTIDESNGMFAPGYNPPATGIPTIPFNTTNSTVTDVTVIGTPGPDTISWTGGRPNLNNDTNADIVWNDGGPQHITIDSGAGDDDIALLDVSFLSPGLLRPVTVDGGPGNDVILDGAFGDVLHGGADDDLIVPGQGGDTVDGGSGNDTIEEIAAYNNLSYDGVVSVPDNGSASSTASINETNDSALRVSVDVAATDLSDLTLTLSHSVFGDPGPSIVLASGLSGADLSGVTFDDAAPTSIATGTAPYNGRFTPSGGTIASLLDPTYGGYGTWTLTASDGGATPSTQSILDWRIESIGPSFMDSPGDDGIDGGDGTDVLSYNGRGTPKVFDSTAATGSGTAQDPLMGLDTYAHVEDIHGTSGNDVMRGGPGSDHFYGGGGEDTLRGGPGDDLLDCGSEHDTVDFSDSPAGVAVDLGAGTASGDGSDTLVGCEGVTGSANADIVTGLVTGDGPADAGTFDLRAGDDQLTASDGGDVISPGPGSDIVDAGSGDDELHLAADAAADSVHGGQGTDLVSFFDSAAGVQVSLDDVANDGANSEGDNIHADVENLYGSQHDDQLSGTAGTNDIRGMLGADVIDGFGGSDSLDGAGNYFYPADHDNIVSFAHSPAGVTYGSGAFSSGADDGFAVDFDTYVGSAHNDSFTGSGDNETFRPGLGNDTVDAGAGDDLFIAEPAADGADAWTPGDGADTVDYSLRTSGVQLASDGSANDGATGEGDNIGTGTERIVGGAGGDILIGGAGAEQIAGNGGGDSVNGRGGNDTIDGGGGDDTVSGGSGNDDLTGGLGADTVLGGDGDDTAHGAGGDDQVQGGRGDDDLFGDAGNDVLNEGATADANGSDLLAGGTGTDTATYNGRSAGVSVSRNDRFDDGATGEQDDVSGDIEVLTGTARGDRLTGSGAADRLVGLGGSDVLTGGKGADVLDGGGGNDTFYAKDGTKDTLLGGAGTDRANRDAIDKLTSIERLF